MSNSTYEYSFAIARQSVGRASEVPYLHWFIEQSEHRVSRAASQLSRLADGRDEFNASSLDAIRAHLATVNLIAHGLLELRTHFSNQAELAEAIQEAMTAIGADIDLAHDSYQVLARAFGIVAETG